jgi:pimeloyl-ACP methyl ester carboxylesterase
MHQADAEKPETLHDRETPATRGGQFPRPRTPGTPLQEGPLPWEWFDFDQPPQPLSPRGNLDKIPPVQEGGAQRVWRTVLDGHAVPLKILRSHHLAPGQKAPRPVLMLVHGMGLTIASFRGVARHLLQTHDLLLPDYSGFSLRDGAAQDLTLKGFVRSLWRIADLLGIERLSLGGNSLGGGICLMAAIEAPQRVTRMVLSNPACFPQKLPTMYRIARVPLLGEFFMRITAPEKFVGGVEFIGYVQKERFDRELRRRYEHSLAVLANRFRLMRIMRQLPAGERDLTAALHVRRLGELHMPVLITWGEQDPLLTPGAGERLARAVPGSLYEPQADLAHMPHEEAPERVGRRWAAFLNES